MKSNKTVVESNLYKSLSVFFYQKIENGQTRLTQHPWARLRDWKLKTRARQSVERDDLSAADKNLVGNLNGSRGFIRSCHLTSSAFNLKKGDTEKSYLSWPERTAFNFTTRFAWIQSVKLEKGQAVEFEIVRHLSGKNKEKFTGLSSDFSENQVFTDYESSQGLFGK